MKKFFLLLIIIGTMISCVSLHTKSIYLSDKDGDGISDKNDLNPEINDYLLFDNLNKNLVSTITNDTLNVKTGEPVDLKKEMINLFSPDQFDCKCDEKLKSKIKKFNNIGFIPKIIENEIATGAIGNLIDGVGANVLVHSFQIKNLDGSLSIPLFTTDSPTVNNFSQLDYLETRSGTFNNFYYSLDCSGYLTGIINAGIGITSESVKTSAIAATSSDKSLVVIKGLMYTPLYQAYKGSGMFSDNKKLRKEVLNSILDKIPTNYPENTEIIINSNYLVVISSNTGNSSFNGEAELNASGNTSFIFGNVSASTSAKTSIGRSSNFSRFKTYILKENFLSLQENITIKSIRNLVSTLN